MPSCKGQRKVRTMSRYLDRAEALRNDPETHYNCAQSVLMAFAEDAGLDKDTACHLTANLGSGMRVGGTCGAMAGGLLVLGLFGVDDTQTVISYWKEFSGMHDSLTQCRDLLRVNAQKGLPKKPHCDNMVYEAVRLTERILREKGKID